MLRLKVIACDVLNREVSYLGSLSQCYVDTTFLHQGLHNTPDKLRSMLQEEIDKVNEGFPYNYFNTVPHYDYIVLGYGLCSNGIAGITSEKIPLVIPRGHDCITLLLGSKEHYKEYFEQNPGTYWYTIGWTERSCQPGEDRYNRLFRDYVERYGEENAEFLMSMEQSWFTDYKNAAYINWGCLKTSAFCKEYTKKSAEFLNWTYSELEGDESLMKRLLNGEFNEDEVLIVPPGRKVAPSYNDEIIKIE